MPLVIFFLILIDVSLIIQLAPSVTPRQFAVSVVAALIGTIVVFLTGKRR